MSDQKPRKSLKTIRQRRIRHCIACFTFHFHPDQSAISVFILFIKHITFQEKSKAPGFVSNHCPKCRRRCFEAQTIHTFQTNRYYREFSHILFAQRFLLRNFQSLKQRFITAYFKKTFQHTHIERFSKASGTSEQIHFSPILQKLRYKHCFIDVIKIIRSDLFKSINTDG